MKYFKVISVLILFAVVSCSKDIDNTSVNKSTEDNSFAMSSGTNGILTFSTIEEFTSDLVLINQMTEEELSNYQTANSYQSWGYYCDNLYNTIAKDSLNPDLIESNVNLNNTYIELIDEDNGDKTLSAKFENSAIYYIMNTDRMYIIDNMAYKVFAEGILATDISHINNLKGFEDYGNEPDYIISIGAGASVGNEGDNECTTCHNAGVFMKKTETNGNDRTFSGISLELYTMGSTIYVTNYVIKPQHRSLYIWIRAKRHIDYNSELAIDMHYTDGTFERTPFPYSGAKYGAIVNLVNSVYADISKTVDEYHYAGYDMYGNTASAPAVEFSKYTYNL